MDPCVPIHGHSHFSLPMSMPISIFILHVAYLVAIQKLQQQAALSIAHVNLWFALVAAPAFNHNLESDYDRSSSPLHMYDGCTHDVPMMYLSARQ
jgi:hypothetical protein